MSVYDARREIDRRLLDSMRSSLGQDVCSRLEDPAVVEIMLNDDGSLWEDRLGAGMSRIGTLSTSAAERLIVTVASTFRGTVTKEDPILECELPIRGARFEGVMPPVSRAPVFTIRLLATRLYTLDDYVADEIMAPKQRKQIRVAVQNRWNMIVVGGTSGGKTTLVNAILDDVSTETPDHRVVILEDTRELRCAAKNVVSMKATETAPLTRLLRATMRLRPDRIIVGEVRDGAALSMLKAWNTGHDGGVCTVHANIRDDAKASARAALVRLAQLTSEVTASDLREVVAESVDLIIPIMKTKEGKRKVLPMTRVHGFENGQYVLSTVGEDNEAL